MKRFFLIDVYWSGVTTVNMASTLLMGLVFCFTIYFDSMKFMNDVIHSIKYIFLNLGTGYFIFPVIDKINKKKNIGKKHLDKKIT